MNSIKLKKEEEIDKRGKMLSLDTRTMMLLTAITALIMGIFILYLRKLALSDEIRGTGFWILSNFCISLSGFGYVYYPVLGKLLHLMVINFFLFSGIVTLYIGILVFHGKNFSFRLLAIFPIFSLIQTVFFTHFYFLPKLRLILNLILICLLLSLMLYKIIRNCNSEIRVPYRITGIALGILILLSLFRLIYTPFSHEQPPLIGSTPFHLLIFGFSWFSVLVGNFGLILMLNLRIKLVMKTRIDLLKRFSSIIGHDLRSSVGMLHQILSEINRDAQISLFSPEEKEQLLKESEKISESTLHLLENLLEWSSRSSTVLQMRQEEIIIDEVIEETCHFMRSQAARKNIEIIFSPKDHEKIAVWADRKMIETVFRNLLSNAIKYSYPKQTIHVTREKTEDHHLRVIIEDKGQGISETQLTALFHWNPTNSLPGTQGEKGTGLGILLCKDFVEKNHGTIQILSAPQKGTQVILNFPLDKI